MKFRVLTEEEVAESEKLWKQEQLQQLAKARAAKAQKKLERERAAQKGES